MDLAALLLILLKHYGLYWLFDCEVNGEYSLRQLEMTLGVGLAQLIVFLSMGVIDNSFYNSLPLMALLYGTAAALELGLLGYCIKVFPHLDHVCGSRPYGSMGSQILYRTEIVTFNLLYCLLLTVGFVLF